MIVLSIFFFLTSFSYFRKLHLKNHELSMLSYQHVLPFIVCNVSAKKKKKKKVAADTIASTLRRENNLFRNTYIHGGALTRCRMRERERERER